jgi:hypothetical protein
MAVLVIGLVVFLGIRSVSIVADPWRDRMAASMGELLLQGVGEQGAELVAPERPPRPNRGRTPTGCARRP